jgi:hypothetical protein
MAKRTERTEANDTGAAVPPARPPKGARRARTVRPPADADTFAARPDPADEMPREEPLSETREESAGLRNTEPSEEDIRKRAYDRYLERGGGHGMDFDDWLEAEKELKENRLKW